MNKKYKRILVANRGDSAVRVIRTCKEMGIETVAIYSKADRNAFHTRLADYAVCVGDVRSKDSYLNAYNILAVASDYKVDAIHPGIGYFSENADFAELCEKSNIDFIGPSSNVIELMGNKIQAKKVVIDCKVPVVGQNSVEVNNFKDCLAYIKNNGYPVILKAANGGGGKGIRIVEKEEDLLRSLEICIKEAEQVFGCSSILIEKYITNAKHIEVQVMADKYGNVIHLGDRECSIQRKNQKLIEESRCTTIDETVRSKMYQGAIDICKFIGYVGLGTVEYLLAPDNSYYFMEMNARLQVEHTITEIITGIDLVNAQIRIAQGESLPYKQDDIYFNGYAIQCRILSEYFNGNIVSDCGKIVGFDMPGGFGVRVDSAYEVGNEITTYYDSLVCKICCYGKNKLETVKRMIRCLNEMQIEGITTNKKILISILENESFLNGNYSTYFLDSDIGNDILLLSMK